MKNVFMLFLKALLALVVLIILFEGWFYWSMQSRQKQSKIDADEQSALCDTAKYITEQPQIGFSKFSSSDISKLKFRLLRAGKIVEDTVIRNKFNYVSEDKTYRTLNLPFDKFLKTDTIIVETNNKLYYKISGYHHYAYLHYGMFGYLGSSDCRLSEGCTVNNLSAENGTLLPEDGLKKI